MKFKPRYLFSALLFLSLTSCTQSCESKSKNQAAENQSKTEVTEASSTELGSAAVVHNTGNDISSKIFLENSGSMFGYLNSGTFIQTVSQIAGDIDLECNNSEYSLINGTETQLGSRLDGFISKLDEKGLHAGDVTTSDINSIFNKALSFAGEDKVSLIISDGIYSVTGNEAELISKLQGQSTLTRNNFVKRLRTENLVTYVIKFESQFNGKFFPASGGSIAINQMRPYYVWVFGGEKVVSKVFKANYFEQLPGYVNISKYILFNSSDIKHGLIYSAKNSRGKFRYDPEGTSLTLNDVEPDHYVNTAFSIGLDLSQIGLPAEYFDNSDVYEVSDGYAIESITRYDALQSKDKSAMQQSIKGNENLHVITLHKKGAPWGEISFTVKNLQPTWINDSSCDTDAVPDENTTFGFKYLMQGIDKAYKKVNDKTEIIKYTITINK